jgi:hypothetical protein
MTLSNLKAWSQAFHVELTAIIFQSLFPLLLLLLLLFTAVGAQGEPNSSAGASPCASATVSLVAHM